MPYTSSFIYYDLTLTISNIYFLLSSLYTTTELPTQTLILQLCRNGDSCTKCCPQINFTPKAVCDSTTPLPSGDGIGPLLRSANLFPEMLALPSSTVVRSTDALALNYLPSYKYDTNTVTIRRAAGLYNCTAPAPIALNRLCPCRQP